MKISVILPVHKITNNVIQCIDTIYSQIDSHELIIVCDNQLEFNLNKKNLKIITAKNKLYANGTRNLGAKYASGNYLCFIDSDIIIKKNFFSSIVKLIESSNIDILNFPIDSEKSNNLFAIYKGLREKFDTSVYVKNFNQHIPFYGFACLFRKEVFIDLKGWPEGKNLDFIMEHEGFQEKIKLSQYKNEVAFDLSVDHYHHKNLKLFTNVAFRSFIWIKKKLNKDVDFDSFKSKRNIFVSAIAFFIPISLFYNYLIGLFCLFLFIYVKKNFYLFLFRNFNYLVKKFNLFSILFIYILFNLIDILYHISILIGASVGILNFFIKK